MNSKPLKNSLYSERHNQTNMTRVHDAQPLNTKTTKEPVKHGRRHDDGHKPLYQK